MSQHSKLLKAQFKIKDDGKHYSCNKPYSYPNIFFYLIDGGRGIGKTTTFLKKGLLNARKGEEFIYMRRYRPEIKRFVSEDSISPIIDGVRYVGDGAGGYKVFVENTKVGSIVSLSTARSYKSVDFSNVTLIIFDEAFVRQTQSYHYLPEEVIQLLEFISTVVRTRTNVKVVLLGNHEDMFSPYHTYWKIPPFDRVFIDTVRGIYCEHAINSPELLEEEKKTGLFNLIKGTSYGDYHYQNKVLGATMKNIINKPTNAKLLMRMIMEDRTCNIYTFYDKNNDINLYCELKYKVIKDNISYEFISDGKLNYLDIDIYKKRFKNYIYRFHFNNRIFYNEETGGSIIQWVIDNV